MNTVLMLQMLPAAGGVAGCVSDVSCASVASCESGTSCFSDVSRNATELNDI